jgi:hypothetical protein
LACPFFSPTERVDNIALPHPARLPLGAAWRGHCLAPGSELAQLGAVELESCNLGYAHACPRLPQDRAADAVRFAISKKSPERLLVDFILEAKHLPVEHGQLEYDRITAAWAAPHPQSRIQKLAECFVQSYVDRV